MPEVNQAYLALVGALMGGSGLKFVESWLNRSKVKDDAASAFRNELRDEVKNLRDELRSVEAEVTTWREKYYTTLQELIDVKGQLEATLRKDTNVTKQGP